MKRKRHIGFLMTIMLLIGGITGGAWAAKVTYHILTLPIDPSRYDYHMMIDDEVSTHRLEAIKVVVDNQTTVELPEHFKSPLATGFTYYTPAGITIGSTVQIYRNNSSTKGTLYDVKGGATPVAEGTVITGSTAEYYVVYTYNAANTIAQLDGSVKYNIAINGKGFLSLNRGRNNRPAVVPKAKVNPEMLASDDFSKVESPGAGITTYWTSGDNKNNQAEVESQFYFVFRFEGEDPYNIIIRTCYNKDNTYIEKNDDNKKFVYKWYKGGQLFAVGTANSYIASDIHVRYTTEWHDSDTENPINPAFEARDGEFHGQTGTIWGSYALLNNSGNTGYVFMGTRTVDGTGATPTPSGNKYNYLKLDNNNLNFGQMTAADASSKYSTEGIYAIKKVTFKVPTPFYKVSATEAHIVSVADEVSQYTVDHDPIETKYLPAELRRKYCEFNGKFYKDAARTQEITHFSQATYDNTEGYQIYLGYDVSASIPFKAIAPASTYSAATWSGATWYELTDEASTQIDGMKLKYDGSHFNNNGADGSYNKTSEFAFIGDPYELQVVYRNATSGATAYYVGAEGTPPASGTSLTAATSATAGYIWQMPYDATAGSFLLQKYKGVGNWYWEVTRPEPVDVDYVDDKTFAYDVATANAQAVTFNIGNLDDDKEGYYILVTKDGTDKDQVTIPAGKIYVQDGGVASFTAAIKSRGGEDREFTISVQEYDADDVAKGTPAVITVRQKSDTYSSHTAQYSTAHATRVKVMTLPKYTYIYNMVDNDGLIAVQGTASQTVFSPLTKAAIPSSIVSPFLVDETVSFYSTFTEGDRANLSGPMAETPPTDSAVIYVKYTTDNLSSKSIRLSSDQRFKVKLNDEYIYWHTGSSKILSTPAVGTGDMTDYYTWQLEGGDPYSMKIRNVGVDKYVNVASWTDSATLAIDASLGDASRFVAMLSNYSGVYEVLAATGTTEYYHIGRVSSSGAETKMYSDTSYAHGGNQLRFELAVDDVILYTLIDQAGDSLLSVASYNPRLTLPADFVSPLVETYYYYQTKADALENDPSKGINEPDEDDGDNHVWVRYTVNDLIGFNNTGRVNDHPYLLKYLNPFAEGYYLEDGNDKLTTGKLKAIYPYCNGDGNLNIYGQLMRDEQMNGGSSTRPRWVWFFESANEDPYHVRIHSRSTISYNSVNHPTYLETKAVYFKQDPSTKHVVTGGSMPGVASTAPTEYMILGIPGAYKLVTTNAINDGLTDERRTVTSFEQYWKTYNMVKLHVLGVSASTDEYSDDVSTWVIPDSLRETLNTRLGAMNIGSGNWHSYEAYASAVRWNGYNDKSDGHEKKVVQKLEHWFQTFDMGNGAFDVESADIPPVLVLLDRHGWEIMRRPLPATHYPDGDEELAGLREFDSPLVDRYYFYSNATKATGCHKYTLRLDDKGNERDQIKVNGEHYSSTSLGALPPANASGVKSSGVLNDQFVIYTVKEEYAGNYDYQLTYTGDKDAGYEITKDTFAAQPYMVIQNGRFFKVETNANKSYLSKPIFEHTKPEGGNIYDLIVAPQNKTVDIIRGGNFIGNTFWYIKPNMHIDEEMGIKWGAAHSGAEPLSANATKVTYKDKSGFDPYNIQLQLKNGNDGKKDGRYLTTHMVSTRIENGIRVGSYEGTDYYEQEGSMMITLEDEFTSYAPAIYKGSEGYDHTNLQISNQTFMAVSDANGNMQLMPRFDHTRRVHLEKTSPWEVQLKDAEDHAKASAEDNNSMGPQTAFFIRPQRFKYHIIDNYGREALRYMRGGDNYPAITDHFKSPLAKDFTYYKGLAVSGDTVASTEDDWKAATGEFKRTANNADSLYHLKNLLPTAGTYQYRVGTRGVFKYYSVTVTKGFSEQEITGSFAAVDFEDEIENDVYVRYAYDEEADMDADRILQGQWFTVKLNNKDLQSDGTLVVAAGPSQGTGIHLYAGSDDSRSLTAEDGDDVDAQAAEMAATGTYYFKQKDAENYWLVNVTTAHDGSTPASYTKTQDDGTMGYDAKWADSKPLIVDATAKKWQWKFRTAPADPSSDYYDTPDPYAVHIFNRQSNYTTNPSLQPSPMAVGIKVPNEDGGVSRFALLSHPGGGYALAVAKTYADNNYPFLRGTGMTTPNAETPVAADTATENSFSYKKDIISYDAQLLVASDILYNYSYNVITDSSALAISAEQDNTEATSRDFNPYLPESAQSPLLNMEDYLYYGFARKTGADTYSVIEQTKLYTLYGLYDDTVYVRYNTYDMDKSNYKIPNKRNETGTGQVERDEDSHDVSMNIKGGLPYNIIWYGDNMMKSEEGSTTISDGGSQALSGAVDYVWYFTGGDPYSIRIKHKKNGNYVDGTGTLVADSADAMPFMLLKKAGYDYGVLAVTGDKEKMLSFDDDDSDPSTAPVISLKADPNHFIVFGLSVHDLIYRLIIDSTNHYTVIPYRPGTETTYTEGSTLSATDTLWIKGTTQRDLKSIHAEGVTHCAGEKYQLGDTISWGGEYHTYSYDAGTVSIGDDLEVPNVFYRPNCTFEYYIEGIYNLAGTASETALDNRFKGLKLEKLMSASELIDKTVVVNIVYQFDTTLATNTGLGFVTDTAQNLWYTFETQDGATPYLAHYTNAWGLQAMEGAETRYTNDYLWTPLGDVYGFKMYNRYMLKNSGGTENIMTMNAIAEGKNLYLAVPGTTVRPAGDGGGVIPEEYGIFELIAGNADGYFRVHPVANTGETKYYVKRNASDYAVLSATTSDSTDWAFGLDMTLLEPYYQRAGYVGGLTAKAKTAYEAAVATGKITDIQNIVYNDANIVHFNPGYYRLHNQPGVSGISPVRYASGYLHSIEQTAQSGGIPMHFYSKEGISTTFGGDEGLGTGFTVTNATRGDIPVDSTECDPSTIFYFPGGGTLAGNPRSIMQTQGLYVAANANGDGDEGTTTSRQQRAVMSANMENAVTFSLMDIGGAVLLIHDGAEPATRRYLNYDQRKTDSIYDLRFYHDSPTDDAKWCMQPVQKAATPGNGEMPLMVKTNNGGDGYYYATFYAPFDVLLPADAAGKTYNAYICRKWYNEGVNPVPVPASGGYTEGKFVPAGTPVILRVKDESGYVTLALPGTSPSVSLSCVFTGSYLDTLLTVDASRDVYTFGLPMTSEVSKAGDYVTSGDITAPLPDFDNTGVGFYINATRNKEKDPLEALWTRNNRYVLHNKIYYREGSRGAHAPGHTDHVQFVPVLFGDEEDEQQDDSRNRVGDGCVYDLLGRKVATEAEVKAGTWLHRLQPGVYIVDGKKIYIGLLR